MKYIFLLLLSLYKTFVSPILKLVLGTQSMCRFTPSCSQYAENVISEHGVIAGSILFTKRFLTCQPFSGAPLLKLWHQWLNPLGRTSVRSRAKTIH